METVKYKENKYKVCLDVMTKKQQKNLKILKKSFLLYKFELLACHTVTIRASHKN